MKVDHYILSFYILLFASKGFGPVRKRVVCYYSSWTHYREGDGNFEVENIDTSLCSHIVYTFLKLDEHEVVHSDNWLDPPNGLGNLKKFTSIKNKFTKVLASVGGWNAGSEGFSALAAEAELREEFVLSVIHFCQEYGFDGFDINWEYPAQREGSKPQDKENYVLLLVHLHRELKKHGLILSVTVGATPYHAKLSYDILRISQCVDFINLMTYNLNGPWNGITGINSPLYSMDENNIETSVLYWMEQGAPEEKLNVGLAMFGRSFKLANRNVTEVGSPSIGAGDPGPFSKEAGYLSYVEVCMKNWTHAYDDNHHSPYAFDEDQWVGYDNVQSIYRKAQFINRYNLGGSMVFSLDADDFRGFCKGGKYPLLNALNKGLNGNIPPEYTVFTCIKDGFYRCPSNCTKFYYCVRGRSYLIQCPPGLKFNVDTKRCDWSWNVNC